MEAFKRKRPNSQSQCSNEEEQINQVAQDIAEMDIQYHPVDEPAPGSYEAFVAQLPNVAPVPAPDAAEQPLPMHFFRQQEPANQPPNQMENVDMGNQTARDDSGIEMGEVRDSFVQPVYRVDMNGNNDGLGRVHYNCGLCNGLFEKIETLRDHLAAVHRVRYR